LRKLIEAQQTRWLSLCVFALLVVFVASTAYSWAVATRIESYAHSIAQNSAPGVTELARLTEDVRQMAVAAAGAASEPPNHVRDEVERRRADMALAIQAYRATEDYPGERDLYARVEAVLPAFTVAIDDVLAAHTENAHISGARLVRATDELTAAVGALTRFNADHVAAEGAAIERIRKGSTRTFIVLRAASLLLAVAGLFLATSASREHAMLAERSKQLAEARASELDMFAGRVAHDLRSPLTVIQMRGGAAERSESLEEAHAAVAHILRQSQRMSDMIEALLTFARAGARTEPGHCADIAAVVEEVVSESRTISEDNTVECTVEPVPRAAVACSASVLTVLLSNLVRNATKYIGQGSGESKRVTVRVEERGSAILFEVHDTGPGLPEGSEKIVFEPFVRFGAPAKGIGLGLATVKRLAEGHGGRVGVESSPGRGCRFWFELPPGASSPGSGTQPTAQPFRPSTTRYSPESSVRA
jgi:signal transduction histidine kinase